jgi:hypothetical protein
MSDLDKWIEGHIAGWQRVLPSIFSDLVSDDQLVYEDGKQQILGMVQCLEVLRRLKLRETTLEDEWEKPMPGPHVEAMLEEVCSP